MIYTDLIFKIKILLLLFVPLILKLCKKGG